MGPTLVIRAQVLTMKERMFVAVAKLSGMSNLGIIFKEMLPNLLPFIAAGFVGAGVRGVFASFYLVGARPGAAARAADGQHHLGRATAGGVLQRLVVVADGAGRRAGADPRLAGPDQHGPGRVRQPARAEVGVTHDAVFYSPGTAGVSRRA